jgi:alginate O-acetyltransferase complex protein AlgI
VTLRAAIRRRLFSWSKRCFGPIPGERDGWVCGQNKRDGMTFTSWQFGIFVAVVFMIYYLPPVRSFQVQWLVLASLFFYGYGQPELLPLLAIAVLGTYLFLILAMRGRFIWLPIGILFNLLLLAFFKYKFLFLDPSSPNQVGITSIDFVLRLPLPIGISFFVFHNISLLVDLTGRKTLPPRLGDVLLYIIFFPQLVSGPITRAEMFMPQIEPKRFAEIQFVEVGRWLLTGFFFKLYVANNLNEMTSYMGFPLSETLQTQDRWLLVILYSYQIYADFFGYSSIALGLALLFGYRLPLNFNLPYVATSFSDFWTRWHMSLSAWLRTYLYIPLGGNRYGSTRTYLNLMIVMGLGGLWHGAGLSYLVWGLLHGLLLVAERLVTGHPEVAPSAVLRGIKMGVVFFCVTMLWILFKLPNFSHALNYFSGMFAPSATPNPTKLYYNLALLYSLPVILQHLLPRSLPEHLQRGAEPYVYGAMAALTYLEAGPETSFIYFQF